MNIGNRIRKYRLQNKLTQKQLASLAHISEISIRKYENNERKPKYETLSKIASVLNVTVQDLQPGYYDCAVSAEKLTGILKKLDSEEFEKPLRRALNLQLFTDGETSDNSPLVDFYLDKTLLTLFHELNEKGQGKAIDQIELLTRIPEYKK